MIPSASELAFEGFKLVRERPRAAVMWGLAHAFGQILIMAALLAVASQNLPELSKLLSGQVHDFNEGVDIVGRVFPALMVVLPLSFFQTVLIQSATFRAIYTPKDEAYGYLRFGLAEGRVILANLLIVALVAALWIGWGVFTTILGIALSLLGDWLAGFIAFTCVIGLMVAIVWLLVRLSLLAPAAYLDGHFGLKKAFDMTRRAFWSLLGAHLLAFFFAWIVFALGGIITVALGKILTFLIGGAPMDVSLLADFGGLLHLDFSRLHELVLPMMAGLVLAFVSSAIAIQQMVLSFGVQALAYEQLSLPDEDESKS